MPDLDPGPSFDRTVIGASRLSAKDMEKVGLGNVSDLASQVGNLKVHEAVYKSLGVPGRLIRGNPFFELMEEAED